MSELLIEQIYPFIRNTSLSQYDLRNLSFLIRKRDVIIEELNDNRSFIEWMDSGRIEGVRDFLESEENLLSILFTEFSIKHPLIKNTKKIINILQGCLNEKK